MSQRKHHLEPVGWTRPPTQDMGNLELQALHCRRKLRFETNGQAKDAALRLRRGSGDCPDLKPYRCALCNRWHLTSKWRLSRRRRRRALTKA